MMYANSDKISLENVLQRSCKVFLGAINHEALALRKRTPGKKFPNFPTGFSFYVCVTLKRFYRYSEKHSTNVKQKMVRTIVVKTRKYIRVDFPVVRWEKSHKIERFRRANTIQTMSYILVKSMRIFFEQNTLFHDKI